MIDNELYGNLSNTAKTQFYFDRIYPNFYLMNFNKRSDNVALNRYVLIEYDTPPEAFCTRVIKLKSNSFCFYDQQSIEVRVPSGNVKGNIAEGSICYTLDDRNGLKEFYKVIALSNGSTSFQKINITDFRDSYKCNLDIDRALNSDKSESDSTVWQKIFTENGEDYLKIANLNSKSPHFNLIANPPTEDNPDITVAVNDDNDYILNMNANWGVRVKEADPAGYSDVKDKDGTDLDIYYNKDALKPLNYAEVMFADGDERWDPENNTYYYRVERNNNNEAYMFTLDEKDNFTEGREYYNKEIDQDIFTKVEKEFYLDEDADDHYKKDYFAYMSAIDYICSTEEYNPDINYFEKKDDKDKEYYIPIELTANKYEPNKYYYASYTYKMDKSESYTEGRSYYNIVEINKSEYKKNKYYKYDTIKEEYILAAEEDFNTDENYKYYNMILNKNIIDKELWEANKYYYIADFKFFKANKNATLLDHKFYYRIKPDIELLNDSEEIYNNDRTFSYREFYSTEDNFYIINVFDIPYEAGLYYKKTGNTGEDYVLALEEEPIPNTRYYQLTRISKITNENTGEDAEDQITFKPTGKSGKLYGANQQPENDIYELSIHLPSIGNAFCDIWDIIYGTERNLLLYTDREYSSLMYNENGKPKYKIDTDSLVGCINACNDMLGHNTITLTNDDINKLRQKLKEKYPQEKLEEDYPDLAEFIDFDEDSTEDIIRYYYAGIDYEKIDEAQKFFYIFNDKKHIIYQKKQLENNILNYYYDFEEIEEKNYPNNFQQLLINYILMSLKNNEYITKIENAFNGINDVINVDEALSISLEYVYPVDIPDEQISNAIITSTAWYPATYDEETKKWYYTTPTHPEPIEIEAPQYIRINVKIATNIRPTELELETNDKNHTVLKIIEPDNANSDNDITKFIVYPQATNDSNNLDDLPIGSLAWV